MPFLKMDCAQCGKPVGFTHKQIGQHGTCPSCESPVRLQATIRQWMDAFALELHPHNAVRSLAPTLESISDQRGSTAPMIAFFQKAALLFAFVVIATFVTISCLWKAVVENIIDRGRMLRRAIPNNSE